jgi:hypothetical protein
MCAPLLTALRLCWYAHKVSLRSQAFCDSDKDGLRTMSVEGKTP